LEFTKLLNVKVVVDRLIFL